MSAAEQSHEAVSTGKFAAGKGIENTDQEVEMASRTAEVTMQVTATSRQQLAGLEQIIQAIRNINDASTQSVSGTRQVEEEVRQLQDLALELDSFVEAGGERKVARPPDATGLAGILPGSRKAPAIVAGALRCVGDAPLPGRALACGAPPILPSGISPRLTSLAVLTASKILSLKPLAAMVTL